MKKSMLIACLFLLTGITQAQFEGQLDMKVTHGSGESGREMSVSMLIKNGMLLISAKGSEHQEMGGDIIFRPDKNVLWIVNPKEKSYLEIVPDKEMMKNSTMHKKEERGHSTLRKTGKSAKIAGYACDEWVSKEDEEETTILGTTKLGNVYEGFRKAFSQWGGQQLEQSSEGWQRELIEKHIFPMKTVTKEGEEITETQEVTNVAERSLASSLFEPPAGYKKQALEFDMNKMMKGLKNGNMRSMNKEELEKMMKQLKKNMQDVDESSDSTDAEDEDDD